MNENWLDMLHDTSEQLRYDAEYLRSISRTFDQLGMNKMATNLLEISKSLEVSSNNISMAASLKVHSDYKEAVATSGALFNAIIEGAIVPKRKKRNENG